MASGRHGGTMSIFAETVKANSRDLPGVSALRRLDDFIVLNRFVEPFQSRDSAGFHHGPLQRLSRESPDRVERSPSGHHHILDVTGFILTHECRPQEPVGGT